MLIPAQLHKDELNKKYISTWYDNKFRYYHLGTSSDSLFIPDNNNENCAFAVTDTKGEVTGFLGYHIDWLTHSVNHVGIISFTEYNPQMIKDVISHFRKLVSENNIKRFEWFAVADNPAISGYDKIIKRYGGRRVGVLRKALMLRDGKLHDFIIYEILFQDNEPVQTDWRRSEYD